MEEWIPYDKFLIKSIYVVNKTIFLNDGTLEIDLMDGRISVKKEKMIKLIFENVDSYKYIDEAGMLERFSKIETQVLRKNNIFRVKNKTVNEEKYHFIVMDTVDNVIEIFTEVEPKVFA